MIPGAVKTDINIDVMNPVADADILKDFRNPEKSQDAFRQLVVKYQERLYWVIRKIVLVHEDADDVLQDTMIKIWKGLTRFRGDAELYTWMYRIAVNEAISFNRYNKLRNAGNNRDAGDIMISKLQADPYYDGNEVQDKLFQAVSQLPEKQREVFKLRYFSGMKYEEMSRVLHTSEGALKASYHHAVKKIKAQLTDND